MVYKQGGQDIRIIVNHVDVLAPPQAQHQPALDQLPLARLAQAGGVAAAQAQDLDVVAQARARQGQHGGREEHGLVVRVGDEQADAPVAQDREPRRGDAHCVQVQRRDQQGHEAQGRQGRVHYQHVRVRVHVHVHVRAHGGRGMCGGICSVEAWVLLWAVGWLMFGLGLVGGRGARAACR